MEKGRKLKQPPKTGFTVSDGNDVEARDWLTQPGNNFCALPYVHMAIEANGDIRPCCMGEEFEDNDGNRVNVNNMSIGEAISHPIRQDFIDAFDRNEQHPACKSCWRGGDAKNTNRVRFSTNVGALEYTIGIMNGQPRDRKIKWLEVKPGNRCNLKCRICGVHNSSLWTKDEFDLNRHPKYHAKDYTDVKFKNSKEYQYTQNCEWIDREDFWRKIDGLEEVKVLHFMGGEPFMVPEHFQLLQELIDTPDIDTSEIIIRYNTNGTTYPNQEQEAILKQFKFTHFQISIDDIGERFNYQRKGVPWSQVEKNLQKFIEKRHRRSTGPLENGVWRITLDPTISNFNIWYMEEFEKWANSLEQEFNERTFHVVKNGPNNVRNLPEPVKQKIREKYKDTQSSWIKGNLDFMDGDQYFAEGDTYEYFQVKNNILDGLRKEKFSDTFPEWYQILKEYGDFDDKNQ